MQCLYVDESGSMTYDYAQWNPYFVISVVRPYNPRRLKNVYKRFVRKYMDELKAADTEGRMFKNGKFVELKGVALTPDLKRKFVAYFFAEPAMDVFYLQVNNQTLENGSIFHNTARAFNYMLRLAIEYYVHKGHLPDEEYCIQLDERNEKTEAKHFLQMYLNTELLMDEILSHEVTVEYFDSACNICVQVADVLANLYYSHLRTGAYGPEIARMEETKCLKPIFVFPPKSAKAEKKAPAEEPAVV